VDRLKLLVLLLLYVQMRDQKELWTVPVLYVKLLMWAYVMFSDQVWSTDAYVQQRHIISNSMDVLQSKLRAGANDHVQLRASRSWVWNKGTLEDSCHIISRIL
jgi:hypothetical protein